MTNMSKKAIHVPRHMIMALATDPQITIDTTEVIVTDCEDNIPKGMPDRGLNDEQKVIAAVNYKPTFERATLMVQHHAAKKTDSKRLMQNWEDEAHLSDEQARYRKELLTMISECESMKDGHFGRITAKHRVEWTPEIIQLINSAPYRGCSKTR